MTVINFFVLIVPVIVFATNDVIDYQIGIPLFISIGIGGWIGAHFAVLKGNVWIKRSFNLVTIVFIIRILITSQF